MVIGGQAALLYGVVRFTEDIDITLGVGIENFPKLKGLLKRMGLSLVKGVDDKFVEETFCLITRDPKTKIRVDFIFSYTPYEKQAIQRARKVKLGDIWISFASPEDLIIHKLLSQRERDIEDLKLILKNPRLKIKLNYIRQQLRCFSSLDGYQDIIKRFHLLLKTQRR